MRNILLLSLFVFMFFGCINKQNIKTPFYIGTYTNASSEGIYLSCIDEEIGAFETPKLVFKIQNPSFMTLSSDKKILYAVSENSDLTADLYSFKIDDKTNELSLIDSISTNGEGACFVSELKENLIGVAHYNSGDVVFVSVENGFFNKNSIQQFPFEGNSINENRQETSHIHSVVADVDKKHAYVTDLGTDNIYIFKIDENIVSYEKSIKTELGAGPRISAFHPNGELMAIVNELDGTIVLYEKDEEGVFGKMVNVVQLSIDKKNSWSADIKFSKSGKFLISSERIDNKISIFKLNDNDIELINMIDKNVNVPRSISFSPQEKYILVANQNGENITLYKIVDKKWSEILFVQEIKISNSVCIAF